MSGTGDPSSGAIASPVIVGAPDQTLYHRLESPTQTAADARQQVQSMEVWGRPAQWSAIPSVKAYRNALPGAPTRGVEFSSAIAPSKGKGTPYEARWYQG